MKLPSLAYVKEVIGIYRYAYRNWPSVLLNLAFRGRARAVTRDGRVVEGDDVTIGGIARLYSRYTPITVDAFEKLWLISQRTQSYETIAHLGYRLYGVRCCRLVDVSDDLSYIAIEVDGKKATMYGWRNIDFIGDINGYMDLNVADLSVLDVGAYVGDSAILFALRGARRVVAVEPSPWAYSIAKKNVEVNGLTGVITLVNCAVGREDGKMLMLPSGEVDTGFRATAALAGDVPVPTCTLDSLIERYGPFDVVKVDCEGCEHESIPYSRRIGEAKEILVEYHDGYEGIVRKLREEGFKNIKYSRLSGGELRNKPLNQWLGLIYASKQ